MGRYCRLGWLAGGRSEHRRQSDVLLWYGPPIANVWPCLWRYRSGFCLVLATAGWAVFRRKSFGGSVLLADSQSRQSHTSPKCQGQLRRGAQLSWWGWNRRTQQFGMRFSRGEGEFVAYAWYNFQPCRQDILRVKPNAIYLACPGVAFAYCSRAADRHDKEAYRSWGSGSTVSAR